LRMTEMARLRRSGCGGNGLGMTERRANRANRAPEVRYLCSRARRATPPKLRQERHRSARAVATPVAQVSNPAVPPISNRQGAGTVERSAGWKPAIRQTRRSALRSGHEIASAECGRRKAFCGLETRDTADSEVCATIRPSNRECGVRSAEDERRKMEKWGFRGMPPLRGLGCCWWGAFYRDGAPTALGLWGQTG